MKKHLALFALLLLCYDLTQAQNYTYTTFPTNNTVWVQQMHFIDSTVNFNVIVTSEDTIIGGHNYKKVFVFNSSIFQPSAATFLGGLREDSLKRVFYIGKSFLYKMPSVSNDSTEILLYNFNVNVGDTLQVEKYPNLIDDSLVVRSIDTIILGNQTRRLIKIGLPTAGYPSGYYNWNWKDLHEEISNDASTTFTHNPKVDICAPGYFSPGLNWDDANKYIACYGTSFSSPMVASALSLLLSINPCLTPDDLEYLITTTAFNVYSIQENQKYAGKLGAGRLDLFAAANLAETYKAKIIQNITLVTSTQTGHSILIGSNISNAYPFGNVTINSGQNVNFKARQLIEIQKGFEALSGSEFTFTVDNLYNPCQ